MSEAKIDEFPCIFPASTEFSGFQKDPFFIDSKNSETSSHLTLPSSEESAANLLLPRLRAVRRWLSPGKHRYPLSPRITILRKIRAKFPTAPAERPTCARGTDRGRGRAGRARLRR